MSNVEIPSVVIPRAVADAMVSHCMDAYPYEGCGLLASKPGVAKLERCYPTANAAASARVYTIDPKDHLRADRNADDAGLEISGVFHSHTHTHAYPSPTDVAQAPVPNWHYVLVSLAGDKPDIRSYRIVDGNIQEETVVLVE
jgi:[CysO sulfur-carrier protein]-S-L-cysteine hydrolase